MGNATAFGLKQGTPDKLPDGTWGIRWTAGPATFVAGDVALVSFRSRFDGKVDERWAVVEEVYDMVGSQFARSRPATYREYEMYLNAGSAAAGGGASPDAAYQSARDALAEITTAAGG